MAARSSFMHAPAALLLAALAPVAASAAPIQSPDSGKQVRIFSIPVTRDARQLADEAQDHLRAQRWQEGFFTLQELLEDHAGDLLPDRYDLQGSSNAPVHAGASAWAAGLLRELPEKARSLYRSRYGPGADAALLAARAGGDRRDLMRVAQSWPITVAARRAWWTLGDLELELGHLDDAERCWRRAADLTELEGEPLTPGGERRFELVRELLRAEADRTGSGAIEAPGAVAQSPSARAGALGSLYLAGPGEGGGPGPMQEADEPWIFELDSGGPFNHTTENYNLYPVLAGERIVVTDSMRVYVVDAFSGSLVWKSDESPGWSGYDSNRRTDFFVAIDDRNNMIAPAVGDGVVVAALQVPLENLSNSNFQGITITRTIPERRLFAFDLESGRPLWDHRPAAGLDFAGTFAEQMKVAGAPVIVGSRIIVPSYQLQSRIDLQLACYELFTGELLWSSTLISGQRELNMFGRHEVEFCAPPVRVAGDHVIVLTQLGSIAAVDLFTGRILWESLYDPIELPKTHSWRLTARPQVWRNTPPVVAGGVVIATPTDSRYIYGLDLETGAQLWSSSQERLVPRGSRDDQPNVLLGADRDHIYLGGGAIAAWERTGGLAAFGGRFAQKWSDSVPESPSEDYRQAPRPLLGLTEIVVPTFDERVTITRQAGQRPAPPAAWDYPHVGNVVLGNGMLFTLNGRSLAGYFDWGILLERTRQRLAGAPGDRTKTIALAELLDRRAGTLFEDGDTLRALDYVEEARSLLEAVWDGADGSRFDDVSRSLHGVYLSQARILAARARTDEALALIDRALPLDAGPRARRDALLQKEQLVRLRPAWLPTLDALVALGDSLAMPAEALRADRAALPALDPWALGTSAEPSSGEDIPVELWARVQRAGAYAGVRRHEDELSDLHVLLERFPTITLPGDRRVGDYARERIAQRIAENGRASYATFEARAAALVALADVDDPVPLEIAIELFPHSQAAQDARDLLLSWAFEEGDTEEVARRVHEGLSFEPRPTPSDAALLDQLAIAIEREGNQRLGTAIRSELQRAFPGRDSESVPQRTPRSSSTPRGDRGSFDESLDLSYSDEGIHAVLGEIPARYDANGAELPARLVVASPAEIQAYDPASPGNPAWTYDSRDALLNSRTNLNRFAVSQDRVVFVQGRGVTALDSADGLPAWTWQVRPRRPEAVLETNGITLILTSSTSDPRRIHAVDSSEGLPLWELGLAARYRDQLPLIAGGRAIILGVRGSGPATALEIDLYRGRIVAEHDLGVSLPPDAAGLVLRDRMLIIPDYNASRSRRSRRNDVFGFDLDRSTVAWSHPFESWQDLYCLARAGESLYLIVHPNDGGDPSFRGGIYELNPRSGAVRPAFSLERDDLPLGLERGRVNDLDSSLLFLCKDIDGAADTLITAIDVFEGKRWSYRLPIPHSRLVIETLPLPAVSNSTVAIAFATRDLEEGRRQDGTQIQFLDRESGRPRDRRRLPPDLGLMKTLQLTTFGRGLFLIGQRQHEGYFQVWESDR